MNRDRFAAIIAAYGGEPRRWPEAERAAARAFQAAHSEEAEAILLEARALDALLGDAAPTDAPSDLLTARIAVSARKSIGARPPRYAWAALAACALFGVVAGFGGGVVAAREATADAMLAAAFDASANGWSGALGGAL